MINNLKILAVVPARGGSKGIPLKNIQTIDGIPLVGLVGKVINQCDFIDQCVISTDSEDILKIANQYGLISPFIRPENLAGDLVGDIDVLTHALNTMEVHDSCNYDIILMLQPTSPTRKPKHVNDCIKKLVQDKFDAVWTISETDSKSHPLKQLLVDDDKLKYYQEEAKTIVVRQQLNPVYHRNGIAYAFTRECILDQKNIMGKNTGYLLIEDKAISIDTKFDLIFANYLLGARSS